MRALILCALLAGCAEAPPMQDNSYQVEAAAMVHRYEAAHGVKLVVPSVRVGSVQPLDLAEVWCPSHHGQYARCYVTLGERNSPEDNRRNLLPHEVAHVICAQVVPGCTPASHGAAWRAIALELGLDPNDGYIIRPEE